MGNLVIPSLVHVISAVDAFGPEKTTINECRALIALGTKCTIVNIVPPGKGGAFQTKVEAANIPYLRAGGSSPIDGGLRGDLRRFVQDVDASIVHSHGFKSDVYCSFSLRSRSIPLVTTVHGWTSESLKVRLYERLQARAWRSYDRVFAVSKPYLAAARRSGVPESKLHLLYNGIIIPEDQAPPNDARRQRQRTAWNFQESHVVIGSVGRLSAEKNHAFLIEVAASLRNRAPNCRFVIVGEGLTRSSIQQKIQDLDLGDRVLLTGHVNAMAGVYDGIDILAINSFREGLPNVLLEAMLNRIPIVSSPVGGVPEVMDGSGGGVVTDALDTEEFTEAIVQLASDGQLRQRMGEAGRQHVMSRFSFQRRMDAVINHYQQLLS